MICFINKCLAELNYPISVEAFSHRSAAKALVDFIYCFDHVLMELLWLDILSLFAVEMFVMRISSAKEIRISTISMLLSF